MYSRLKELVIVNSDNEESQEESQESQENKEKSTKSKSKKKEEEELDYDYDKDLYFKSIKQKQIKKVNDFTEKVKERVIKYCGLCGKRVNNEREFNNHIQSKRHMTMLKQSIREEVKKLGSIDEYLYENHMLSREKSVFGQVRRLVYGISIRKILNE